MKAVIVMNPVDQLDTRAFQPYRPTSFGPFSQHQTTIHPFYSLLAPTSNHIPWELVLLVLVSVGGVEESRYARLSLLPLGTDLSPLLEPRDISSPIRRSLPLTIRSNWPDAASSAVPSARSGIASPREGSARGDLSRYVRVCAINHEILSITLLLPGPW